MEIELDFLGGSPVEKFTNNLLHAGDLFGSEKEYCSHKRVVITGTPDLDKLCERMADASEKSGGYAIFVGIRTIDGQRVSDPRYWKKDGVKTVSMKQNGYVGWQLLEDAISRLGYAVKKENAGTN